MGIRGICLLVVKVLTSVSDGDGTGRSCYEYVVGEHVDVMFVMCWWWQRVMLAMKRPEKKGRSVRENERIR